MSYTVRVLYWQAAITLQIVPTKLTQLGLMLALILIVHFTCRLTITITKIMNHVQSNQNP